MDELLMRGMPHSAEAEQAVLGSMLIDGDCVKDVMEQLQAEDFYLRQNREIFETIAHMFVYSQPVDGVTVASEMEKNGLYTDATRPYLLQLMEVTPTSANVGEYVKIVRDKALMRQVATAAANITAMVQEGGASAADMLESAEQKVYAIRRGRRLPVVRRVFSTSPSAAIRRVTSCSRDISSEKIATVLPEFFAADSATFSAILVFPIPGRAASSSRSDLFRPLILPSTAEKPVDRPGSSLPLLDSSSSRFITSCKI